MAEKRATIRDIAEAAGVSKTTVSRYINGRHDLLSGSTCKRIEKAIELAHYRPSAVARSLKTRKSYLVGVIVANITTPFATSLLNGISRGLSEGGYIPIFGDAADSPETEKTLIDSLISHQVDGLIVNTTTAENTELVSLSMSGMPIVLCDRYIKDHTFDIAVSPYRAPTLQLLQHAHDQRFERAVLFTQDYQDNSPRRERHDAFVEMSQSLFGAAAPESNVYVVNPWEPSDMEEAARRALQDNPSGLRTVVYASNTVTLIATYNAFKKLGLQIPGDLGLCGPDDWGWAHQMGWEWPEMLGGGITTFETNPYEMGHAAAELMLKRLAEPEREREEIEIPTKLVIRSSTLLNSNH